MLNDAPIVSPASKPKYYEQIVTGRPCEVQEVSTRGVVGGTFTLTYGGETTPGIPWNSTSDTLQAALEVGGGGYTNVGAGCHRLLCHLYNSFSLYQKRACFLLWESTSAAVVVPSNNCEFRTVGVVSIRMQPNALGARAGLSLGKLYRYTSASEIHTQGVQKFGRKRSTLLIKGPG